MIKAVGNEILIQDSEGSYFADQRYSSDYLDNSGGGGGGSDYQAPVEPPTIKDYYSPPMSLVDLGEIQNINNEVLTNGEPVYVDLSTPVVPLQVDSNKVNINDMMIAQENDAIALESGSNLPIGDIAQPVLMLGGLDNVSETPALTVTPFKMTKLYWFLLSLAVSVIAYFVTQNSNNKKY